MVTTDFAKEVRIFGIGETICTRYQILIKEIRKERVKADLTNTLWSTPAQIISVVVIYGLFVLVVYRNIQGNQTIGDLAI